MKYPMFKVYVRGVDALENIREVFSSGYLNEGLQVGEFQRKLERQLGARNIVMTNSCTSALTIAYKIAGVGPGSDVVSSPMTCVATNTPIVNLGGNIVWADILPTTGCIDPDSIERSITDETRAIAFVNWGGAPANLESINEIGERLHIPTIQDAAHSFGATWDGQPISDYTDFTCLSFQAIKHLSTGDGGALICRDPKDYVLGRKLKWFGYDRDSAKDLKGEWKGQRWDADIGSGDVGYKFNMNNVAASIGLAQIDHIDEILMAHRNNAEIYNRLFASSDQINPLDIPEAAVSSYWVYTCVLAGGFQRRDRLLELLNSEGIGAGLVHLPNDLYSAFRKSRKYLPGTREFAASQISIPCGWWLSENDCRHIAERVLTLLKNV